ncbi:hypothetical protein AUEXF2481DRAFT_33171 [Aureobasidium subglaciale EXF-2481]|uniref:BHLH domain-containing protein n=1 Tax=Aureobasidium subglaciale (strain EXF-2481) TaxID=1043005 RepID=A0A074Y0Z6_AURSE|nr:uncharacterized protein AUEXF2481DRAFT_33171 [Aureobasidium subglaciale EXF-2481]KAI5206655.1 hypothetical protein E4T38_03739 [Aureobasidium subglaciale]KAI5225006.1 hypothetical protein E4T41_05487 [Aureobasidium subglaciale]KAI5225330.1 hypothetical protein E4T40_03514 [Aureobasidium subglaciale]KAI5261156.1 hypothetical protein E4T46_05380 [Aureobasidium subglaciale]KEQ91405.1 hypothetical protein AUEXF2481DRAFT_33171 [Aureobasidium subglaciale EXF-2481]
MASSHLPPTPASSTDIRGKEKLVHLAPAFTLPPAAYADGSDRAISSPLSSHGSDSSYHPHSPVSLNIARRKSTAAQSSSAKADDTFALPPPPTRNRKIIQMKPKSAAGEKQQEAEVEAAPAKATGGRKKSGNTSSTAASRKVARKTAHSLIERRRRSKMNEEFGVLKDMIPACQGQEMHKLAILQASIEYLRYLERCITDLKADNTAVRQNSISQPAAPAVPTPQPAVVDEPMEAEEEDDDDQEMSDTNHSTGASTPNGPLLSHTQSRESIPSLASLPSMSHFTNMSPAIAPSEASSSRHYSISSTSAPSFSPYIHSQQASPFFLPTAGQHEPSSFALTSPALRAQDSSMHRPGVVGEDARLRERREKELDHEAMAALLMLNSDRRTYKDRSGRGMSVQDLLSN